MTELEHRGSQVRLSQVDMPALNTTQFNWVKNYLPTTRNRCRRSSSPRWARERSRTSPNALASARGWRRRRWQRSSGNRVTTRFMDWYLARTGYQGQQADGRDKPMLPTNLYESVPGDHGSHGAFDDSAHELSPQAWAHQRRRTFYAGAATAVVAGLAALTARKGRILSQ